MRFEPIIEDVSTWTLESLFTEGIEIYVQQGEPLTVLGVVGVLEYKVRS